MLKRTLPGGKVQPMLRRFSVIAAATLFCCKMAHAAPPSATSTVFPPMKANLDSQGGTYSYWQMDGLDSISAACVSLTVQRLGSNADWQPLFAVEVKNGKDSIVFKLKTKAGQPPMSMHVETWKNDVRVQDQLLPHTIDLNQKVEVSMEWTPSGDIMIQAGHDSATVMFGEPIKSLEIGTSTGEADFNPIEIGQSCLGNA